MPLALTVGLVVLGAIVLMGAVGYLIDKTVESGERNEDHN